MREKVERENLAIYRLFKYNIIACKTHYQNWNFSLFQFGQFWIWKRRKKVNTLEIRDDNIDIRCLLFVSDICAPIIHSFTGFDRGYWFYKYKYGYMFSFYVLHFYTCKSSARHKSTSRSRCLNVCLDLNNHTHSSKFG